MCGIFGAYTNVMSDPEKKVIVDLAIINTLRGKDSTGFAVSFKGKKKERKYAWNKSIWTGYEHMINQNALPLFLTNKEDIGGFIGHCRAATVGVVTKETAHPFRVGDLIGVHNGTVRDIVPKDAEVGKEESTDSYHLYKYLSEHGPEKTYKDFEFKGAFALAWFNTKDHTLNIMRNAQRPLHYIDCGVITYFSSDKAALELVIEGSHHPTKSVEKFEVGYLYTAKPGETKGWQKTRIIPEYQSSQYYQGGEAVKWTPPHRQQGSTYSKNYSEIFKQDNTLQEDTKLLSPPQDNKEVANSVVVPFATHQEFATRLIPNKMIAREAIGGCGCFNCTNTVDLTKPIAWVEFLNHNGPPTNMASNSAYLRECAMPMCDDCSQDENVLQAVKEYGEVVFSNPKELETNMVH